MPDNKFDLSVNLAGLKLENFVYNASGVNNEILKQLQKIADSKAGAVLSKSTTIDPRTGNENPKYIVKSKQIPGCTLNSMGLPNIGFEKSLEMFEELSKYTHKTIIASVSGMSMEDNIKMFKTLENSPVQGIEWNPSCPNMVGKSILGYDMEAMDQAFQTLRPLTTKTLGVKLPPYMDITNFDRLAESLLKNNIDYIVSTNTIGNCLLIDSNKESVTIKPKNGLGGLAGSFIKPLSLGNVWSFYQRLKGQVKIVGVGGIHTGNDAFEYLLAGADAVQIGTGFAQNGTKIFEQVETELVDILNSKGYTSLDQVRGNLKTL